MSRRLFKMGTKETQLMLEEAEQKIGDIQKQLQEIADKLWRRRLSMRDKETENENKL